MSLLFNERTHTYYWNGIPVPSVTQVIKAETDDQYQYVDPRVLELAAQFGKATHTAVHLEALGILDYSTLDEPLIPYLNAFKRFACDYELEIEFTEKRLYSQVYRFAGTLDLKGTVHGIPAIIDWKTGILNKLACGLQLGAYEILDSENFGSGKISPIKLVVQLRNDSTYRVMECSDPMYRHQFIKLLQQFDMEEFQNEHEKYRILESA
jgi:hypothetical protein